MRIIFIQIRDYKDHELVLIIHFWRVLHRAHNQSQSEAESQHSYHNISSQLHTITKTESRDLDGMPLVYIVWISFWNFSVSKEHRYLPHKYWIDILEYWPKFNFYLNLTESGHTEIMCILNFLFIYLILTFRTGNYKNWNDGVHNYYEKYSKECVVVLGSIINSSFLIDLEPGSFQ
jgi:hypothetical protein